MIIFLYAHVDSMLFNIKLMEMYDCNKSLSFLAHMDAHTHLGVHGCGLRL